MRFIILALLIFIGSFFYIPVFCQEIKKNPAFYEPKFNLRTSLNSWFDFDAGLMLGIGYQWSRTFAASIEPGLIFYKGLSPEDPRVKTYPLGIKVRAEVKLFPLQRRNNDHGFFIAPEFHYKYVRTKKQGNFGINCTNGQCAYFQRAWYTEKKNEIGGLLKFGTIFPLLRVDKRWLIEVYTGLGFKYRKFRFSDIPVGAAAPVIRRNIWFNIDPEDPVPLIPFGVKLLLLLENKD